MQTVVSNPSPRHQIISSIQQRWRSRSFAYGCLKELRCRLCQFDLETGDPVAAFALNDRQSTIPDMLSYFPFDVFDHYDAALHVTFHLCGTACRFDGFITHLFHTRCYAFVGKFGPVSTSLLSGMQFSFQPPVYLNRKRLKRIQAGLSNTLCETIPKTFTTARLPPEIIAMIAELLVPEYAAIRARAETHQDTIPSELAVDLSADVYVWYKDFDGVRYIQSLSNAGSGTGLLLHAKEKGRTCVTIGEDHLGIREVHFAGSSPGTPGLWWRVLMLNGIASIRTVTDVGEATADV